MIKYVITLLLISVLGFSGCKNLPAEQQNEKNKEIQTRPPSWARNSVIYEVNLRQFTNDGSIKAFTAELPRLKKLGVDILWMMPMHPIGVKNKKGSLGSYYAVKDYLDINPEFGTKEDFRKMVDEAHKLGMYVIIDWVANHTAWDNQMIVDHPDWYTLDENGNMVSPYDWSDVADLNYDKAELRSYMTNAMMYWVKEMDIDGFRCDVAGMVPTDFWEQTRDSLESIKPVFMLAEAEDTALLQEAFDADYGWTLMHVLNTTAKGERTAADIANYLENYPSKVTDRTFKMNFTTNHDENSWNGTTSQRYGDNTEAFAVLTYLVPGMPLIYSGQEANNQKALEFFEKDPIVWGDYPLAAFYQKLAAIKKENPALANGSYGGAANIIKTNYPDEILAFSRKSGDNEVIALFNIGSDDLLVKSAELSGSYQNLFENKDVEIDVDSGITIPAHGYLLLKSY